MKSSIKENFHLIFKITELYSMKKYLRRNVENFTTSLLSLSSLVLTVTSRLLLKALNVFVLVLLDNLVLLALTLVLAVKS